MGKGNDGKLYKWQEECLKAWESAGFRGIVNAVTGSGKTRLAIAAAARLAKEHPDLRIKIVAPTIALANQWRQNIIRTPEFSGERTGFYGDGVRDEGDCRVMIYVVNSARDGLQKHIRRDFALNRHVLLICDECHRYKSEHNRRIFGFLGGSSSDAIDVMRLYFSLGLSATPFNGDSDEILTDALGSEIYRYDLTRAAQDETIAQYYVCQVAAGFMEEEAEKYRELSEAVRKAYGVLIREHSWLGQMKRDAFLREVGRMAKAADMDPEDPAASFLMLTYQRKEVSVMAESRIRCCTELVSRLRDRGRILIFSERIGQAEEIYKIITRRYGNIAGLYHSGMTADARQRVLEDYRSGRTGVLVSCKCLDEGLDVPDAAIGIVVSSSAVQRQRIQRLGRIVRSSEGKESACLYYIFISGSMDDRAYLSAENEKISNIFDLTYYSSENAFANDMYEYAALELLRKESDADRLGELRKCIIEGLCRPDYLLDEDLLEKHIRTADNKHEKNYYTVMRRIHQSFIDEEM